MYFSCMFYPKYHNELYDDNELENAYMIICGFRKIESSGLENVLLK